jgi:hypothetical protein
MGADSYLPKLGNFRALIYLLNITTAYRLETVALPCYNPFNRQKDERCETPEVAHLEKCGDKNPCR